MKKLLFYSALAVSVVSVACVCPCLSKDSNLRILNQARCICDGVSTNFCFICNHRSCDCPSHGLNMGTNFLHACCWVVYDHTSDKSLFVSLERDEALEAFFNLSTPDNWLDLVRFDVSKDYLQNSTIFVHK